jgi:hypothetical protein
MKLNRGAFIVAIPAVFFVHISCSGVQAPPAKGTPAFYWSAAEETFQAGDYLKTSEHLENLARRESEYTGRIRPWRLVLLSGLMQGYLDMAEQFQTGARNNKGNPTPFRREMDQARSLGAKLALQFGEAYVEFQKVQPEGEVNLAFPYPVRGSLAMPAQMTKTATGVILAEGELGLMRRAMLQRGVIDAVCQAVGAKGDSARAQELLKNPPVSVPRGGFELAMAHGLFEAGQLFGPMKLSLPDRQEWFYDRTLEALKKAPEGKEAKEWKAMIEKERKKKR